MKIKNSYELVLVGFIFVASVGFIIDLLNGRNWHDFRFSKDALLWLGCIVVIVIMKRFGPNKKL